MARSALLLLNSGSWILNSSVAPFALPTGRGFHLGFEVPLYQRDTCATKNLDHNRNSNPVRRVD